ncbi:hypothetical protein JW835_00015 [bacterium]|nr:hypothetical protein [bacterium]
MNILKQNIKIPLIVGLFINSIVFMSSSNAGEFNDWGIKLGICISNQDFDYKSKEFNPEFENYYGPNLDLFYNFIDLKNVEIIGQLTYSKKGCKHTIIGAYVDTTSPTGYTDGPELKLINRIDYISFSLLGKLNKKISSIRPYLFLGPRFDYPIKVEADWLYTHLSKTWGLSVGVGTEFHFIKSTKIIIEFQYSPDFTNILNEVCRSAKKESYEIKMGFVM